LGAHPLHDRVASQTDSQDAPNRLLCDRQIERSWSGVSPGHAYRLPHVEVQSAGAAPHAASLLQNSSQSPRHSSTGPLQPPLPCVPSSLQFANDAAATTSSAVDSNVRSVRRLIEEMVMSNARAKLHRRPIPAPSARIVTGGCRDVGSHSDVYVAVSGQNVPPTPMLNSKPLALPSSTKTW
jgi:hypothetical protein